MPVVPVRQRSKQGRRKDQLRQRLRARSMVILGNRHPQELEMIRAEMMEEDQAGGPAPHRDQAHAITMEDLGSDQARVFCDCGYTKTVATGEIYNWWRGHTDPVKR